jgi:hypothetical protein
MKQSKGAVRLTQVGMARVVGTPHEEGGRRVFAQKARDGEALVGLGARD